MGPFTLLAPALGQEGSGSFIPEHPTFLGRGNSWFEDYCKNLWCLEREMLLQKSFVHKLAFQDPRIGFEWLRAPRRTNQTLLMGSEPRAETWEKFGWRKGFAAISANIRLWGFKALTAGKGWGESTSEPFSKEHNQLGAGRGRLFLLHFICVGISNMENIENSLLKVVPVQPWISPDLPLVVIITLSLQGTHNFQIWLGSPKLEESPADVGEHQGQRKGGEMLEFPSSITAFCPAKQQRFNCLFKQHQLSEVLSFLGIAWAPESLCEAFPCCCCRGKSALGKLLMVQNLSVSDLQPAVYPSHFAPGKEQIFIEMFFLIQNTERGEKMPQPIPKGMGKYKYWIIRSHRARGSQKQFLPFLSSG